MPGKKKFRSLHKFNGKRRRTIRKTKENDANNPIHPVLSEAPRFDPNELASGTDKDNFADLINKAMQDTKLSPSFQKLKCFSQNSIFFKTFGDTPSVLTTVDEDAQNDDATGRKKSNDFPPYSYRIVDLNLLSGLFSSLLCPVCKQNTIKLTEGIGGGSLSKLKLTCFSCDDSIIAETFTSHKFSNSQTKSFDITRRLVASAKESGIGFAGLSKFCAVLNMPPPLHKEAFSNHLNELSNGSEKCTADILKESVKIIKMKKIKDDPAIVDGDIINIAVSYDGSWHTRGHKSHYGVGAVIEIDTGLVVDYDIASTFCHGCQAGKKLQENSDAYKTWKASHTDNCKINHTGSAHAMEADIAKKLWLRSEEKNNMRYTVMLADGDCKTYKEIKNLKPYGNIEVEKEECINHMAKRMRNRLTTAVTNARAQSEPIGGKGKLTKRRIEQFQNYYGRAIKDNAYNLDGMRDAVFAIMFHNFSTESAPHHNQCPKGLEYWCFYQRAMANNLPPDYTGHSQPLPNSIVPIIAPIFKELGDPNLLKRCIRGKTQNTNEALHSLIWRRCPKTIFPGLESVKYATSRAIGEFNSGASSINKVLEASALLSGSNIFKFTSARNKERIRKSFIQSSEIERRRRKAKRLEYLKRNEQVEAKEGPSYASGAF